MSNDGVPEGEERRLVEYEHLNSLGRAVFLAGTAAGFTSRAVRRTLSRVRIVAQETERAFREGLAAPHEEGAERD